ncbi:LysR family transcriptional regulator [Gracilibacillus salitolerans]|uniref:LysR family transcriptional regulator n=1 Tax=Gracilibacillus salitolerans TaxID=2663022 RepID=A0A5Q2THY9_9BACI|nr:LysR family transcriptional regulator [Gracilibacillus salitolerans]QGH34479.1 LysR family transcriptional regulator [Gracilibacillus salitolerans]
MELSWVRTFITAAKTGNFRKTADHLFISQPSVTVHIKQLEKVLGIQLFQRDGKRVKLTEAGRRYLNHAIHLTEVYESGMEDIKTFSQGYTTKLTLAISPLIADTILPFVLKQYIKKHPEVEITIEIVESKDIEQVVNDEVVDIGLSCLQSFHPNLESKLLHKDKVVLVAPHDGMDFESALPLDEEEILSSNRLLTHNHPGYWDKLSQNVKLFYPGIQMMKVSQTHITKRFIIEGLGVSFLPFSTVRRELLEGKMIEVDIQSFPPPQANTYAIFKFDHKKQREFLEFLAQYHL